MQTSHSREYVCTHAFVDLRIFLPLFYSPLFPHPHIHTEAVCCCCFLSVSPPFSLRSKSQFHYLWLVGSSAFSGESALCPKLTVTELNRLYQLRLWRDASTASWLAVHVCLADGNISVSCVLIDGGGMVALHIRGIVEWNNTVFDCLLLDIRSGSERGNILGFNQFLDRKSRSRQRNLLQKVRTYCL